jgi:hypothetical protein
MTEVPDQQVILISLGNSITISRYTTGVHICCVPTHLDLHSRALVSGCSLVKISTSRVPRKSHSVQLLGQGRVSASWKFCISRWSGFVGLELDLGVKEQLGRE